MLLLLFLTAQISIWSTDAKIPKKWPICKSLKDKQCILKTASIAYTDLCDNGIPKWGVPKLDPFSVEKVVIESGGRQNGPVSVNMELNKASIFGLRNSVVKNADILVDGNNLTIILEQENTGNTDIIGRYKLKGRALLLPLDGEGNFKYTTLSGSFKTTTYATLVKKGNKTFIDPVSVVCDFQVKNASMSFDNLFNGNKELNDNFNKLVNENVQEILPEIMPSVEKIFGDTSKEIMKRLSKHIPYDEWFTG